MGEHNPYELPRVSHPATHGGRTPSLLADWIRRIRVEILLGAAGLIATPVSLFLVGTLLRPFEKDVAQGYYSALSIFGMVGAPLGAIYWLVGGILLAPGFARDTERRFRPWLITLAIYGVLIAGSAVLIGLFA